MLEFTTVSVTEAQIRTIPGRQGKFVNGLIRGCYLSLRPHSSGRLTSSGIASLCSWLFFFRIFPPEIDVLPRTFDGHRYTKRLRSNSKSASDGEWVFALPYPELASLPFWNLLDIISILVDELPLAARDRSYLCFCY